ncbi:hypothetical protein [Rubidibacter lacunae]|nr:hypothetical protein [Rubidibacter lacunae]
MTTAWRSRGRHLLASGVAIMLAVLVARAIAQPGNCLSNFL